MNIQINRYCLLIWLASFWLPVKSVFGQCPDKTVVWNTIIYLRDSSKLPAQEQLQKLKPLLDQYRQCSATPDSAYVLLCQRIGWLNVLTGRFEEGRRLTEQSIVAYQRGNLQMKGDKALLMRSYNNLRLCCDSLGDVGASRVARDSAIQIGLRDGGNYTMLSFLLFLSSEEYFNIGDYYRSMEVADMGYRITFEHRNENLYADYYLKNFPAKTINSLIFLKRFSEAEELLVSKIRTLDPKSDQENLATYFQLYARTLEKKDWKRALNYYNQSFNYYLLAKMKKGCAETMNNAGFNIFYHQLKDYPRALSYYQKALMYADDMERPNILQNIGNVFMSMRQFDSSAYYFHKAFKCFLQDKKKSDIPVYISTLLNSSNSDYLIDILLSEAEAYVFKYRLTGNKNELALALENYRITDRLFQQLQRKIGVTLSKLSLLRMGKRLYEPAIEICLILDNRESAFYFFEKSRAVLLFDQLRAMSTLNPKEFSSINQVRLDIRNLEHEQDTLSDKNPRLASVKKELFTLRQKEESLSENIRHNNPLFFQNQMDTVSLSATAFRKSFFVKNGTFIELLTGDSALYVMVMTKDDWWLKRVPIDQYRKIFYAATHQVTSYEYQNAHFNDFRQTCADIYKLLFDDIIFPEGPIVVSADGNNLPFEILMYSDKNGAWKYLLETHPVSYTYSATYWVNDFVAENKPNGRLLGIAPVSFPANTRLPNLTGSDLSLNNIIEQGGNTRALLFKEANRVNFFKLFSQFTVVQLYTHASDSTDRGEPVIWLADSAIYLSELVSEVKPACRLIVLSACQTGLGQTYVGEGVFSFNRGFAALGVPSAIANLWEADSRATYRLTEKFYEFLSKGMNTDEALRQAKLSLLASSDFNLPYYWAAPVLVGRSEKIILEKAGPGMWLYFIAAMVVLMAGVVGWVRKSKVKSQNSKVKSEKSKVKSQK